MPAYKYKDEEGVDHEFEGPLNAILALKQAEETWRPGGRLFKEVHTTTSQIVPPSWEESRGCS